MKTRRSVNSSFAAFVAGITLLSFAPVAQAGAAGAALSCLLGPGTGEWAAGKQSLVSCCVEHLIAAIPIFGQIVWIGGVIDAYKGVGNPDVNYLFGTFNLGM